MPKSKKNKIVHLTQVKKKSKDHKDDLMKQLESHVKQYEYVYVFDFDSTKSDRIMNLRVKMKQHGRIYAGRNSLVSLTMKSIGSKTRTDYNRFLKHITGHRGLLFTDVPSDKLIEMLETSNQEFRNKLLGYAHLNQAASDGAGSEGEEEDDDEGEEDDEEEATADKEEGDSSEKRGRKSKKPLRYIRFRPIKKMKKKKAKGAEVDADGDVVLADENSDGNEGEEEVEPEEDD